MEILLRVWVQKIKLKMVRFLAFIWSIPLQAVQSAYGGILEQTRNLLQSTTEILGWMWWWYLSPFKCCEKCHNHNRKYLSWFDTQILFVMRISSSWNCVYEENTIFMWKYLTVIGDNWFWFLHGSKYRAAMMFTSLRIPWQYLFCWCKDSLAVYIVCSSFCQIWRQICSKGKYTGWLLLAWFLHFSCHPLGK